MSEIEKHQAEYQKVVADYEKAVAEIEKGYAQIEKLEAEIEKGKADNQKLKKSFEATLLDNEPILKLGYTYIDYRTNKSLNASNSITEEERRVVKKAFDDAKCSLDEFIANYNRE
jgi:multidrug resistance efflux pump